MNNETAKQLLVGIKNQICTPTGLARTNDFSSLRTVDGKVREVKMILTEVPNSCFSTLVQEMNSDVDFEANSRRVRLEALNNYVSSALTLISSGAVQTKKRIIRAPDVSRITATMPGLKELIEERWFEAQKCQHIGASLSAVVLMGSILEGLLLSRVSPNMPKACRASKAPRDRNNKVRAIQNWSLNSLIDVAVEIGWLKSDRGKFSHALRESRNVVHPWVHISQKASYDKATCRTCWEVLLASVDDLRKSL